MILKKTMAFLASSFKLFRVLDTKLNPKLFVEIFLREVRMEWWWFKRRSLSINALRA